MATDTSKSPDSSVPLHESSNDAPTPSRGFKSFWKKSDKPAQPKDVTFVQHDPAKRKRGRLSQLLGGSSSPSSPGSNESDQTNAQKRRQQVYQAQKRHRNRKANYVIELEAEVARYQHLDAVANHEKTTLLHENNAIREILAKHSVEAHFDMMNPDLFAETGDGLSDPGGAMLDIRWDNDVAQERIFLKPPELPELVSTTSATPKTDSGQADRPVRHAPVAGDSWAALDFILALEWPCKDHIKHYVIDPEGKVPASEREVDSDHALTMSAAVYQSAQPFPSGFPSTPKQNTLSHQGLQSDSAPGWYLPHSEIDKLVRLSEKLELDDDEMTPAQAYSAIREAIPSDDFLRPMLEAMKTPLGSLVHCVGIGACMDAPMFWQHFNGVLRSLEAIRTNLLQT